MEGCKGYERLWVNPDTGKSHCVDRNLADRWLVGLNRLTMFRLTSICEGHLGANNLNQQDHSLIRLRLKNEWSSDFRGRWDRDKQAISGRIHDSIVHSDTLFKFGWSELEETCFYLDLDCTRKRETADTEPWVADWFERVIAAVQTIDRVIDVHAT